MTNNSRIISLAAGTHPDFSPVETIHAASNAGFTGCGVWFEADDWTNQTTKDVKQAFKDTGLLPLDIEVIWINPGDEDPNHDRQLAAGGEIGVKNVLIVSSDPIPDKTKRRFEILCDKAERAGIAASLEFLPITEIKNLADALDIVTSVGHPNGHILVDPTHFHRTGGHPSELEGLAPELFSYAQYCDGIDKLPDDSFETLLSDAIDGRLLPGEGAFPLKELIDVLDPQLPLSVELRSKSLRDTYTDATERAIVVFDATMRNLGS
ncbi:MAG: sugar phosphate isomerase/epimerase [Alphaproteobacteria bacterium]|nr:MAG: sugar phosphate isomerase/epimerase [Alphaproteobacteria bacterium]